MQNQTPEKLSEQSQYTKKTAIISILAVLFLLLDRLLKTLSLSTPSDITLISGLFYFSHEKNYFIAFSLPLSGKLLLVAIIIIIAALVIYSYKNLKALSLELFPLVFIIMGASSNLFDRIKYGYVIDYFHLKYFSVFNIADAMIVLGALFLLFLAYRPIKN